MRKLDTVFSSDAAGEILKELRELNTQAEAARQDAAAATLKDDPKGARKAAKNVKTCLKKAIRLNADLLRQCRPAAARWEVVDAESNVRKIIRALEDANREAKSAHK